MLMFYLNTPQSAGAFPRVTVPAGPSSFASIIHRNSLAILERADLVLDLVELPRHPAVLLVHLNTFFQRHAGGHWLQQRRAGTTSVTLNALLLKNKTSLMHQTAQLDVAKFNASPR